MRIMSLSLGLRGAHSKDRLCEAVKVPPRNSFCRRRERSELQWEESFAAKHTQACADLITVNTHAFGGIGGITIVALALAALGLGGKLMRTVSFLRFLLSSSSSEGPVALGGRLGGAGGFMPPSDCGFGSLLSIQLF
jgi:hypothetical protein